MSLNQIIHSYNIYRDGLKLQIEVALAGIDKKDEILAMDSLRRS
jgi:hypothetical protein